MDIRDLEGKVLIVGGGIAGLMTALKLAPEPCVLLSKAAIGEDTSSILAQGGVAACVGADDSVALQVADTLAAGDGLCDAPVVEKIIAGGPAAIEDLAAAWRAVSTARRDGSLKLGLEAAHSRNRIVHAGGDKTGREITLTLAAAVRATPSITILEGFAARRLSVEDGEVAGLIAEGPNGASSCAPIASSSRPAASAGSSRMAPIRSARGVRASPSPRAPAPCCAISNSCNSIRPRSTRRARKSASSARPCAAKAQFSSMKPAAASWQVSRRGTCAARCRRARRLGRTARRPPHVPRSRGMSSDLDIAFPRRDAALPRRRHRSCPRSRSRSAPPRIITWAASKWTLRAAPRSKVCGPSAKLPQRACMAPTGSPAIRCSKRLVCAGFVAESLKGARRGA